MKNLNYYLIIFISILAFIVTSCNLFYSEPISSVTEDEVWNSLSESNLYLNNLYDLSLPVFSSTRTTNYCDETYGDNDLLEGTLTLDNSDDMAAKLSPFVFDYTSYAVIRRINLFLENVGTGSIDADTVKVMKAQAYFLRAWVYWHLVRLYGGVPMVMNVQQMSGAGELTDEILVKRNKTSECISLIAADLDSAAASLPSKWDDDNYGRVTKFAALSLKGRVLLFWASPQFNPNNDLTRWQWAYNVNKQALDSLDNNGYGLYSSFTGLFNNCVEKSCEAIFVRVYNTTADYSHAYDKAVRPAVEGVSGGGTSNNATWDLVSAFPMANGTPVDSTSSYNSSLFAYNRDPRFYATIAYLGSYWALSNDNTFRVWPYYYFTVSGGDTTWTRATNYADTKTGFYCKKYINPSIDKSELTQIGTDWMEIRYAEVLLNFAECANEIGESDKAYNALKLIRDRAGVGSGYIQRHKNDVDVMREIIMNERQIELAFEDKRFWDLRRREMYTSDLGYFYKKFVGRYRYEWYVKVKNTYTKADMESKRTGLADICALEPTVANIKTYNAYFQKGYKYALDIKAINYRSKYDFFPIPQSELDKNVNLEQTKDWGGTFDPLQ